MVVYYDSKTGNVERFLAKVKSITRWDCIKITDPMEPTQAGHLVTHTTKLGAVPDTTQVFMQKYGRLVLPVSSSGNMNWGNNFAVAADKLAKEYAIPVLIKFELSGFNRDVDTFIRKVKDYADKKMDTPQQ